MKELSEEQKRVMLDRGTERPFSGALLHEKREGTYNCIQCGNPLFLSGAKFDSGTGWPSFDQAIPGSTVLHEDYSGGMRRTEVVCAKCGGHLGHMFDDGPSDTTGKRYCINSVCLDLETKK